MRNRAAKIRIGKGRGEGSAEEGNGGRVAEAIR